MTRRLNAVQTPAASVELRQASPEDVEALRDALWPGRSVAALRELFARRAYWIAAWNGGKPVGFGQLTFWPRSAEIGDLMVTPEWRGRGVGTAMICCLLDRAWVMRVPVVEIGAAFSNPRALALYRRLGFRDNRIIDLDLGDGPEPVMYLTMSRPGR